MDLISPRLSPEGPFMSVKVSRETSWFISSHFWSRNLCNRGPCDQSILKSRMKPPFAFLFTLRVRGSIQCPHQCRVESEA